MRNKAVCVLLSLLMIALNFNSQGVEPSDYQLEVIEALDTAGENRSELEKVLTHYESAGDSLKLEAACYLIGNMEGHCYVTYALQDTAGKEYELNVLDFPDFKTLKAFCDSLEGQLGELSFEKKEKINDLEVITADFLIEQIDYAFRAWREKPWAKDLSFEQFCQYVLPYRGSNEPLEHWRETFWNKYKDVESRMENPNDPIQAAALINDDIKSWFRFDSRYYLHPTDQGLAEMLANRMGRCEDMTNLTIYAMRANGLAVTSDYTPYWADSGNNHAWNAIVTPEGEVIPFMGAEANPGRYKLAHKLAKVYRKMFGQQKENLIFQERKQEKVPHWLAGKSYIDVTTDYTDASDVAIAFDRPVPDSVDIAYLCVFNSGEWQAIHWGRIYQDLAVFTDMGKDIAYLPALYIDEEIMPYGPPFILEAEGDIQMLLPEKDETMAVELISTTRRQQQTSTDGIAETFLTPGTEYELFYWLDGWQSAGTQTATDQPLRFENVPVGCLYWLVVEDSDHEERIFTLEDGRQVWW